MIRATLAVGFLLLAGHSVGGPVPCEVKAQGAATSPVSAVTADTPSIEGPKQVAPHKLVRLEVKDLPAGAVVFWDVNPEDRADLEEVNGKAILTGPAGSYTVKARVVRVDGGNLRSQTLRHKFVIGEPGPPGPPVPPTPPGPTPPGPTPPGPTPPLTGLAKLTYDAAVRQNDPATARKYAENHAAIGSAIAAGAYASMTFEQARAAIFKDLAAANRAVTTAAPAWDAFGKVVTAEVNKRQNAGSLNSVAAIAAMIDEIRVGLEAAGGK